MIATVVNVFVLICNVTSGTTNIAPWCQFVTDIRDLKTWIGTPCLGWYTPVVLVVHQCWEIPRYLFLLAYIRISVVGVTMVSSQFNLVQQVTSCSQSEFQHGVPGAVALQIIRHLYDRIVRISG